MKTRGGREHQVRLRRRWGELVLERQREGRTGPPRPLQVKASLLARCVEAQLLFSFRFLSGLPACSFRPNIAPTRASTPPPPPASSRLGHPHPGGYPASSLRQVHVPHFYFGGASCLKSLPFCCMGLTGNNPGSMSR